MLKASVSLRRGYDGGSLKLLQEARSGRLVRRARCAGFAVAGRDGKRERAKTPSPLQRSRTNTGKKCVLLLLEFLQQAHSQGLGPRPFLFQPRGQVWESGAYRPPSTASSESGNPCCRLTVHTVGRQCEACCCFVADAACSLLHGGARREGPQVAWMTWNNHVGEADTYHCFYQAVVHRRFSGAGLIVPCLVFCLCYTSHRRFTLRCCSETGSKGRLEPCSE